MKIGIIGAGNIGGALAGIWASAGHEVLISGSHDPGKLRRVAETAGHGASTGAPADAAAFGEVVLLAVPWPAVPDALRAAGPMPGKVLLDTVNALKPDMSGLAIPCDTSASEEVAKMAPGTKVVKAYNHVFAQILAAKDRNYGGVTPTGFYCGDDAPAKEVVARLIADSGFDPVDAGPLVNARHLESLAMLVITLGYPLGHGTQAAWKLINR